VFRGDRFPELVGHYIFSDYGSGNIWAMTHDGLNALTFARIAGDNNIAGFGVDPRNGDVLMADIGAGTVKRLAYASVATNFPQTLADTGVFSNLVTLTVNTGIVPFEINVPFWSDNAIKTRWFSVPSTNLSIDFDAEDAWTFPTGTVWIKHFDLLLTNGVTSSVRRLETRILVKNSDITDGGYGVTYRWGTSFTNANLVGEGGLDEDILVDNGGSVTTQRWHYPGRSECLFCHRTAIVGNPGFALGFNTVQMNKEIAYSNGVMTNQLRALNNARYFSTNVSGFHSFRALAPTTNTAYSLEYRARSYLQANCRQCHFPPNGVPAVPWDARIFTPLSGAEIINGELFDDFGDANNRVIVPGNTNNSVMHYRISRRDGDQMPPLASNLIDTNGVALIAAWIAQLTSYQTYAQWQTNYFGSSTNPLAAGDVDADGDGNVNDLEYLTGTDPTNTVGDDAWDYDFAVTNGAGRVTFDRIANRGFDVQGNTNLLTGPWESLDVPENAPFFDADTNTISVTDPQTNAVEKHFRIRVYEP
jgi:hypothetical protein